MIGIRGLRLRFEEEMGLSPEMNDGNLAAWLAGLA